MLKLTPTMTPPVIPDPWEANRQQETLLRTRMLRGEWETDLIQALQAHIGSTRLEGWQAIDMSSNPFRVITTALAVLYDAPPTVRNQGGDLTGFSDRYEDDTAGVLEDAGLWSVLARNQADTIGCRQHLIRITVDASGPKPAARFRPVSPAFVVAKANPEAPDVPVAVAEARLRLDPTKDEDDPSRAWVWTWDVLDVSDPKAPVYEVRMMGTLQPNGDFTGADVTEQVLGGTFNGKAYPYRFSDGTPHLPYVMYHAQRGHGQLWTPYEWRELVRGSISLAVGWTEWYHILRDASWPQRYMLNAQPVGATVDSSDNGDDARAHIVTDPAVVMVLQAINPDDTTTPQVGQWDAGGDPVKFAEGLEIYGSRLAQDAGLSPSDVQKTSGNARSGYAISMTNQGKREAQNRFREAFTWADTRLLSYTAAMLNQEAGTSYPESGYSIEYAEIPLSPDELRARDEHVLKMLDAGLMSKDEAYRKVHPGITQQQAEAELDAMQPPATPQGGQPPTPEEEMIDGR